MQTYAKFRPTGCDVAGLGLDEQQDWLMVPVGTNRDADILTRSNWEVVKKDLFAQPDSDNADGCADVQIHRFGHWACGWFEIMIVRPGTKAAECAEQWEAALSDYPVASDEHYSNMQFEETEEYWSRCNLRDRKQDCERARVSVFEAYRPWGKLSERLETYLLEHIDQ